MTLPPRARPVAPAPTVPPPEPQEQAEEHVVKRLETWQKLAGMVVIIAAGGAAFTSWQSGLAKVADVEHVRAGAAAEVAILQTSTGVQLSALQASAHALAIQQAAIEANLANLNRTTDRLLDQLLEVARATGARRVPEPPPVTPPLP